MFSGRKGTDIFFIEKKKTAKNFFVWKKSLPLHRFF